MTDGAGVLTSCNFLRAAADKRAMGMGDLRAIGHLRPGLVAGPITPAHLQQLDDVLLKGDAAAGAMLPTAGNRFELLDGSTAFARRVIEDIDGATRHVNVTDYAMHPGAPGGPIAHDVIGALARRANEGLPVTVTVDAVGTGLVVPKRERLEMVEMLRDNHAEVRVKRLTLGRGGLDDARLAADHRKIFEVDGKIVHEGGVNVVDAWSPWHDVMLRAEGPIAAQAGALLAGRWVDLGGTVTARRAAILREGLTAPVQDASFAALQLSNGNRHRRELTEYFVQSARTATTRLWITNPYLGDARVVNEITTAARRGVDVRVLLSPKAASDQPQDIFTDPLRRAFAYRIHEAGGEVTVLPEFSHAKGWIADDSVAIGSFNLDRGSTRRNYENAIATNDPSALAQVVAMFERQRGGRPQVSSDVSSGWRRLAIARELLHVEY